MSTLNLFRYLFLLQLIGVVLKLDHFIDWEWTFIVWPLYILLFIFTLFSLGIFMAII